MYSVLTLSFCVILELFSRMPRILNCLNSDTFYFAPHLQWVFDFFARLFTVINSSINFFIYSMPGSEFRRGIGSFLGTGDSSQTFQQTISLHQVNISVPERVSATRESENNLLEPVQLLHNKAGTGYSQNILTDKHEHCDNSVVATVVTLNDFKYQEIYTNSYILQNLIEHETNINSHLHYSFSAVVLQ